MPHRYIILSIYRYEKQVYYSSKELVRSVTYLWYTLLLIKKKIKMNGYIYYPERFSLNN